MGSSGVVRSVLPVALRSFLLTVLCILVSCSLSSCNGGGAGSGSSGSSTPTVLSTTPSSTKTAMAPGDTAQGSCTVEMTDGSSNSNCKLSSTDASVFTVDSATGSITAVGDGSADLVSTSDDVDPTTKKPVTGQIAITVQSKVTGVSVSASPTSITTAGTSQITATLTCQGSGCNPAVDLTASGGTLSNISLNGNVTTADFSSSVVGTIKITAQSKQDSSQSGSVQVTVNRAPPVITGFDMNHQSWFWCRDGCGSATLGFEVLCTGCQVGDNLSFHGYWPSVAITSSNLGSDGRIVVEEPVNAVNQPAGNWIYATVEPVDGTAASNTMAVAYLNAANSGTFGPSGEVVQRSHTSPNAYFWQLSNGTWSLVKQLPMADGVATVYDVDGANQYLVDGGATYKLDGTFVGSANITGDVVSDNDASGSVGCVVQPGYSQVSIFTPGIVGQQPSIGQTGSLPYNCRVAYINSTPYVFATSFGSSSVVWKFDASGNAVGSQTLTGVTSWNDIVNGAGKIQGNWQLAVIKTGSNAGFFAVLASYDDVLDIYDGTQNSMPLVKEVSLAPSCVLPQAVTAIDAANQFRVACLVNDGLQSHTSFVGVDLSGNVTPLAATSTHFPQGFVADGNYLYILDGAVAPDNPSNQ